MKTSKYLASYTTLWFIITIHILDCHHFSDIHISQGSVATYLRCAGMFTYEFVANLLSISMKEFWKSVNIWGSFAKLSARVWCLFWLMPPHGVCRSFYCWTVTGVLGYYDANAYPAPSYYNPVPWRPVDIPEQKPRTKKRPLKHRANLERYFWCVQFLLFFVSISVIFK